MSKFFKLKYTNEAEWHSLRRDGLGGSDAATVLNFNKYKSDYVLFLEKTGKIEPENLVNNEAVFWGNVHEPVLAEEFARRHPEYKVRRENHVLISKEHPYMFANLDRVITDTQGNKGILEIKTASEYMQGDWAEEVPLYYYPQMLHYMIVTGYTFGYFVVLIGGNKYKEYRIEFNEQDAKLLIDAEAHFWNNHVLKDIEPPINVTTQNESTLKVFSKLYNAPNDELMQVSGTQEKEALAAIKELSSAKEAIKKAEEIKKECEAKLKGLIANNKGIQAGRHKVTWVRTQASRFNSTKFKEAHADLYKEFSETSPKDMGLRFSEIKA